jgi:hypothetical protein
MRTIERISISTADRERLERLVRDRNTPQKVVWRARIVLLASDRLTAEAIASAVGKSLLTVRRWRRRYVVKGVDGLLRDATPHISRAIFPACSNHARRSSRELVATTPNSARLTCFTPQNSRMHRRQM